MNTNTLKKALLDSRVRPHAENLKLANTLLKCWLLLAVATTASVLLVLTPTTSASIISILAGYLLVFVPTFLVLFKKRQDAKDAFDSEHEQYIFKIGAYAE